MSHRINLFFISYITGLSVTSALGVRPAEAIALNPPSLSAIQNQVMQGYVNGVIAQTPNNPAVSGQSDPSSPTVDSSVDSSILKLGSRGERVSELQELLQKLGYYEKDPDGIFGDQTKSAVIAFQRKAELPVDGQVGTTTLDRLREAAADISAPEPPANSSSPEAQTATVEDNASVPAEASSRATTPEETASNGGRFWWMAALIAASAVAGFALYRYTRPRIKRPLAAKPSVASHEETATERSPTSKSERVATEVFTEATPEPTPTTQTAPLSNGATTIAEATTEAIPTEISPVNETTRLAKVDIVDELIGDLRSPDPVKRRKAIWELGQVGDSKAVQPLVDLMMDADSSQRSLILAAISEIGVRTLKPMNRALLLSLQDHSSDVRKNAIRDVTRVYDLVSQMSELLAHAASDPDTEVQETARWALGQLGRIRGVPDMGNSPSLSSKAQEHLPGDV
ncbi:MAG: peptidoglycan-binding protein [Oculatellaceae cyanobacterium bins.114]|nr:peptidoglycan-binding protein [Oculatellaceae cyanobacterium bins.114]